MDKMLITLLFVAMSACLLGALIVRIYRPNAK